MPSSTDLDRVDVELPFGHGLHDVLPQHQVLDVLVGHDDALGAGDPLGPADVEEPFDLLVDAPDRLDLALLVDRTGHGEVLAEGKLGQAGEDGIDLGGGGAVAVDAGVGLLESKARGQREGLVLGVFPPEISAQDEHPLVVRRAAQVGLAFDVDDAGPADRGPGGDPGGLAESELAHIVDRQAVDLADDRALGIDQDAALLDHLLDLVLDQADPFETLQHGVSTSSRPITARPPCLAQ